MKHVFLSYHYDDHIKPIARQFERLIRSHDLSVIDGQRLGGQQLTDGVKKLIRKSDAMIVLLTKREQGQNNAWVAHERTTAFNAGIPFIAVIEDGVDNNGPFEDFEYINYKEEDLVEPLLKVSETLLKWKLDLGEMIEVYLEPDDITEAIRKNMDRDEIVRYRFFDEVYQWTDWRKPVIKPTAGGISLYLDGVKKDSELQIQVRTNQKSWSSDVVNRNLRVLVK